MDAVLIAGAIVYGFLLILTIFNRGWLFSSAVFFMTLGILVYVEMTLTMAGKTWIVIGLGFVALLCLVKTIANFGSFRIDRY